MSKAIFGVDLGGTTVKMGLFDTEGNVKEKWEIPTRKEDNGKKILPDIAASIKSKMNEQGMEKSDRYLIELIHAVDYKGALNTKRTENVRYYFYQVFIVNTKEEILRLGRIREGT